ncbi:MAG: 1,2-phenylacetyl-CoA epoxidase subunit PaaC [Pseudomonadota bacterium]
MGDSALILGHRLSEWCGHGPALEEDIALANTALDLIGQARMWLTVAGRVEGSGRSADDLAFHRDAMDFRNLLIVERPNGDFGHTLMRQFLFDCHHLATLRALSDAAPEIAEIAAKALKEVTYHQERSADLVLRLGDGSEESHRRMQAALDALWPYTGELRDPMPEMHDLADTGADWAMMVGPVLSQATLSPPDLAHFQTGGRTGRMHSEHLGHLLAVMQSLPRAHPDATW